MRFTQPLPGADGYCIPHDAIEAAGENFTGPAIQKLAQFENVVEQLKSEQIELAAGLEQLRQEGKQNSSRFREMLSKKVTGSGVLMLFKTLGLDV